jgi:DNA-binding GntR family transcriptional regulator
MQRKDTSSSLTQAAYERLRNDVLVCRLRPGERLKINELSAVLSVSPGAIREALSRLTSEGLIVASPQRGFFVAPISIEELRDLTMVRTQIEESCLRSAIAHGDLAWEAGLVAALHLLNQTPERVVGEPKRLNEAWVEAHAAFHAALVAGCTSPWLLRLRAQLYAQTERYRRLSVPLARAPRDLRMEHQQLATVVLARDADAAAELMARHLNVTMRIIDDGADLLAGDISAPPESASPRERTIAHDATA